MSNKISAEAVAQQFAISIQMLLEWIEQREKAITRETFDPRDDEHGTNELLKAADGAKWPQFRMIHFASSQLCHLYRSLQCLSFKVLKDSGSKCTSRSISSPIGL